MLLANASFSSVYIAGQVLKKLLDTFPEKAGGQQALAEKKAKLIYDALDANPSAYRVSFAKPYCLIFSRSISWPCCCNICANTYIRWFLRNLSARE